MFKDTADICGNKYRNVSTGGFSSKLEAAVYQILLLRQKEEIFVEAKGVKTDRWLIAEKLWKFYGPAPLELWKGDWRQPKLVELIIPN